MRRPLPPLLLAFVFASTPAALAPAALHAQGATAPPPAGVAGTGGRIVARSRYVLPPFDSLGEAQRHGVLRNGSRATYDSVRADVRFALEKVRYLSDGLIVVAYTYAPAASAPNGARAPVVIYNRGSWVSGDEAPALAPVFHRLARAGFVVVAPQYRGSDGGEGRDELGGADVADIVNAAALAARLPGADAARLFMYGESRGGMMTFQAIRDGVPIRAAATVGAFTDLDAQRAGDERSRQSTLAIWPDFDQRHAEIAERRSAVRWADRLTVPLLLMHGAADPQVSPVQTLDLARRLAALGREYELHVFAGEGHVLAGRAAERDALVIDWFRRHMP